MNANTDFNITNVLLVYVGKNVVFASTAHRW